MENPHIGICRHSQEGQHAAVSLSLAERRLLGRAGSNQGRRDHRARSGGECGRLPDHARANVSLQFALTDRGELALERSGEGTKEELISSAYPLLEQALDDAYSGEDDESDDSLPSERRAAIVHAVERERSRLHVDETPTTGSGFQSVYVALAEVLDGVLVTCDGPLSRAPAMAARVELLQAKRGKP